MVGLGEERGLRWVGWFGGGCFGIGVRGRVGCGVDVGFGRGEGLRC